MHTNKHTYSDGTGTYDVESLWKLAQKIPATLMPVDEFLDDLYADCWDDVLPIDAADDEDHEQRVQEADLFFPILVKPNGDVMDGMHRLVKASRLGYRNILVKVIQPHVAQKAICTMKGKPSSCRDCVDFLNT